MKVMETRSLGFLDRNQRVLGPRLSYWIFLLFFFLEIHKWVWGRKEDGFWVAARPRLVKRETLLASAHSSQPCPAPSTQWESCVGGSHWGGKAWKAEPSFPTSHLPHRSASSQSLDSKRSSEYWLQQQWRAGEREIEINDRRRVKGKKALGLRGNILS